MEQTEFTCLVEEWFERLGTPPKGLVYGCGQLSADPHRSTLSIETSHGFSWIWLIVPSPDRDMPYKISISCDPQGEIRAAFEGPPINYSIPQGIWIASQKRLLDEHGGRLTDDTARAFLRTIFNYFAFFRRKLREAYAGPPDSEPMSVNLDNGASSC